jgi:hypothetical protein
MSSQTEIAEWEFKGHKVRVGPVERVEERDRFGRRGYRRGIWMDSELIAWSRGQDLMAAKWHAVEEVTHKIRQSALRAQEAQ